MTKTFLRALTALALVTSATVATPDPAQASPSKCGVIHSATVGGFRWSHMPTGRTCSRSLSQGVAGTAQLSQDRIIVYYSERNSTTTQVAKATVHELTHHVEWRTTPRHRARLYRYVGLNLPSGNYFAIDDSRYRGSLAAWKRSPRERLAESVVNCTFGSPNHGGMRLVPRRQCRVFLAEFRSALAVAR